MNSVIEVWVRKQAVINPFFVERLGRVGLVLFYAVTFVKTDQFAVRCCPAFKKFTLCGKC